VIHRFAVGRLNCTVISDGQPQPPWEPPLDSFFTPESGVPAAELAAAVATEGAGRTTVTGGYNCLVVETPAGLAVIDTGLGARFLGYGPIIGGQVGRLGEGLIEAGLSASDLAAVVFTHLHQDHVRGATWPGELAFPVATGHAHAAEIAFWSAGAAEATASAGEHLASAREAIALFGERLRAFEYGAEILPGVRTVQAAGHTPGHTAILLESAGERLLCVGDSFHDRLQLRHPGWCTPWDHDRYRATASRRSLLARAADENIAVHAYHLPFPGLGSIMRHGDVFEWRSEMSDPADSLS
jgi:glyoxylase-like metal-dependent hydrolase (beta-lactamase superfamily II)